jgi:alkylhydroperoxidase/carboxymuconolactone decarboxylase family protein YurZ
VDDASTADVDAVMRAVTCSAEPEPATSPMVALTRGFVFGQVWARPGLSRRDRRLVTIPCTTVVESDGPARAHLFGSLASGDLTRGELEQAIAICGAAGRNRLEPLLAVAWERAGSPGEGGDEALTGREERLVAITCAALRQNAQTEIAGAVGAGHLDKTELDEVVVQFAAYAGFLHATVFQWDVDQVWQRARTPGS